MANDEKVACGVCGEVVDRVSASLATYTFALGPLSTQWPGGYASGGPTYAKAEFALCTRCTAGALSDHGDHARRSVEAAQRERLRQREASDG